MTNSFNRRLAMLSPDSERALLARGLCGIERETLRIDAQGRLALTAHPSALGSALTHPEITTDYSEAMLEFITPARQDIEDVLAALDAAHRFAASELRDEFLWSQSMPCLLPQDEEAIPVASYGVSPVGLYKSIYREGLALRYGKRMQCISGIHYNFSLTEELWPVLLREEQAASPMDLRSAGYVALIRNFHRYSWLIAYLFGASPAATADFLRARPHGLQTLSDDTVYLPYATSLRMSDLGYESNAQARFIAPYNSLPEYIDNLSRAVSAPYAPYEKLGLERGGKRVQLNANVLQVENEYYSTIRPKQICLPGERPLEALQARGIQYLEVRCLDIDPFRPTGFDGATARFLDAFLLFCLLQDSPSLDAAQVRENANNFALTAKEGRRPDLALRRAGNEIGLRAWGLELLGTIGEAAALLDDARGTTMHRDALEQQRAKLEAPELTPSARVLAAITDNGGSFLQFGLAQTRAHAQSFNARPLSEQERARYAAMATASLAQQEEIERTQTAGFDEFLAEYEKRLPKTAG